ncbi:unnamed protein product [Allacma fusca]|uniref:Uncharacterized protein n=1 Tax=Allacma fusca TaxID=39272 RepID=A0A8J2L244_9HEXA|nr:unnamed protein product [Allacma fusca]
MERPRQCPNNRCLRLFPMGLPMSNGFKRCPRCWLLTHRSFLVCKACGRHRLAHEVHLNNVNLEGVDPIFLNIQPQQPAGPLPEQDMVNDPEGDAVLEQVPEVDGKNNNKNN